MTFNIELARSNMIDHQVRPWDVVDPTVLDTLSSVRREDFVPPAYRNFAFADLMLPLGQGEVMMKPVVEGRVLQALALQPEDTVLEIGTGSGYLTACMGRLSKSVTSVDCVEAFTTAARANLTRAQVNTVTLVTAEAVHDYRPEQTFDAVVVTGAVETVPQRFLDWLKTGGRAFVISGHSPAMRAGLVHRTDAHTFTRQSLFETDLPYLVNAAPVPGFIF